VNSYDSSCFDGRGIKLYLKDYWLLSKMFLLEKRFHKRDDEMHFIIEGR